MTLMQWLCAAARDWYTWFCLTALALLLLVLFIK